MVIQQAMAASLPVVATRICGVPYQIEHRKTGCLFEPGDIGSLVHHLEELLADEDLRSTIAAAARQKALSNYRAEDAAADTVAVYRSIDAASQNRV